jgi:hypothetical protein
MGHLARTEGTEGTQRKPGELKSSRRGETQVYNSVILINSVEIPWRGSPYNIVIKGLPNAE